MRAPLLRRRPRTDTAAAASTPPTLASCHRPAMDDERPPICPSCGVTMVPAALSAEEKGGEDWVCLECEETIGLDTT